MLPRGLRIPSALRSIPCVSCLFLRTSRASLAYTPDFLTCQPLIVGIKSAMPRPFAKRKKSFKKTPLKTTTKDIDWKAVQVLYMTGQMSMAEISRRYGIPYPAMKARSQRGQWDKTRKQTLLRLEEPVIEVIKPLIPLQETVIIMEEAGNEGNSADLDGLTQEASSAVLTGATPHLSPSKPEAGAMASDVWARRQAEHRDLTYRKAHGALRNAKIAPPKDWKSAEIVDRMARKASGLDEDTGPKINVSVNVGFLNGGIS